MLRRAHALLLAWLLIPSLAPAQVLLPSMPPDTVVGNVNIPAGAGNVGAVQLNALYSRMFALQNMPANSYVGQGGAAVPFATLCTLFTSSSLGCVPASGGGTTNFLRADGAWAAPPGGGGGSLPSINDGHLVANASGSTATAADTAPSTWVDHAFCSTVGQILARFSSTWVCGRGSPVNVTWFGVGTGNSGSTNSTAFAAAQSACGACTYFLPAGVYNFASTIVLADKQQLRCEGMSSTNINMSSANTNTVQIGGSGTNTGHQRITGCYFTTSAGQSGSQVIYTQNAHNIYIDHIIIVGGYNGIFLGGSSGGGGDGFFQFVSNFYIVSVSNIGIAMGGSGSGSPAGVYLDHGTIYSSGSAGIFIAQTGGFSIESVESTLSGGDGLLIAPTTGQSALYGFVTNSFFDTSTDDGIKIAPTGSGTVGMMSFVNSWAATSVNTGVGVIGGGSTTIEGMNFTGMTIYNNQKGGLYQNGGGNSVITGSKITCNNQALTGLDNLNFNNTSGVVVTGNIIGGSIQSLGACQAATHDIDFQSGNNNTIITSNNTHGGSIVLTGAGASTTSGNNL